MVGEKIIIVEDELITAKAIATLLKEMQYNPIAIVSSGTEAISNVKELKPDLVLMDIVLEGDMNGIEAADLITKEFQVPIIFLTAYGDRETLEKAKITEPFAYIVKPISDENELRPSIELAIYNHKIKMNLREGSQKFDQIKHILDSDEISPGNLNWLNYQRDVAHIDEKIELSEIRPLIVEVLDSFGNLDRFKIVQNLKTHPMKINEIQELIQKSQSTTSHHIKKIEQSNIIKGWKKGKFTYYSFSSIDFEKFRHYWGLFTKLLPFKILANDVLNHNYDSTVDIREIIEAIGNSERFSIIELLITHNHSVSSLENELNKSQSTISHHIKVLEKNNLIIGAKNGKFTEYSIKSDNIQLLTNFWNTLHSEITNWIQ